MKLNRILKRKKHNKTFSNYIKRIVTFEQQKNDLETAKALDVISSKSGMDKKSNHF